MSTSKLVLFWAVLAAVTTMAAGPVKEPAKVTVAVAEASPGTAAPVTVRLAPADGIKINRYPRIKLTVPARPGLVAAAEVAVGSETPPPPDQLETNYFKTVDPVQLSLHVEAGASAGKHDIPAQLLYYYCVAASGFCAPAKIPLMIALTVR
jgi:hypothetical protein